MVLYNPLCTLNNQGVFFSLLKWLLVRMFVWDFPGSFQRQLYFQLCFLSGKTSLFWVRASNQQFQGTILFMVFDLHWFCCFFIWMASALSGASDKIQYTSYSIASTFDNKNRDPFEVDMKLNGWHKFLSLGIQLYSQMMIGVFNHLLSIVFRFHYHSQKMIGSLGIYTWNWIKKLQIVPYSICSSLVMSYNI